MVDYFFDIIRILAEVAQLGREHPIWASVSAVALVVLRYLAGGIGSATVSHVWTEYVLKRRLPAAPSPTEDDLRARLEDEVRGRARAEAERDTARGELARERRRSDRLEAELRNVRVPRRRGPPRRGR